MQNPTVAKAKISGLIPEPWHYLFKDTCEFCGEPMQVVPATITPKCANPHCYRRVAGQVVALLQDLGIKGWGATTAYSFVKGNNIKSIVQFILEPPMEFRNITEFITGMELSYPQLIKLIHIPRMDTRSAQIFDGIKDADDFLEHVERAGGLIQFIQSRVGGQDLPAQLCETIIDYAVDIEFIGKLVKPVEQVKDKILVCLTGNITRVQADNGKRLSKDEYIRYLNQISRPHGLEFIRSDAKESVVFMVADYESDTSKYQVGVRRGILVTSDVLLEVAKNLDKDKKPVLEEEPRAGLTNEFGGASNG